VRTRQQPADSDGLRLARLQADQRALGKEQGDRVLRAFAEKLLATSRKYDHVARMSGDSSSSSLPDAEEAMQPRIRQLRELRSKSASQ